MCITEFDEELFRKGMREEGMEEGIQKGEIKTYWNIVGKKIMTLEQVAEELQMTVPQFLEKVQEFGLN